MVSSPPRHYRSRSSRLVAITYADGRAGQANEFEAELVCGIVQQIFLTVSQNLVDELDLHGDARMVQHTAHTPDTILGARRRYRHATPGPAHW